VGRIAGVGKYRNGWGPVLAMTVKKRLVQDSLDRLDRWIEAERYKGWDPYDALNSPFFACVEGRRVLGMLATQVVRRSPFNLRRMLKIKKSYIPKAMGLFLWTYAMRFEATGDPRSLEKCSFFFEWLLKHRASGYCGWSWGYNFPWANRVAYVPAGTPTIVTTSFIALGILSYKTALERRWVGRWGEQEDWAEKAKRLALEVARGGCEFILGSLARDAGKADEVCFSYTPVDRRFVYNANLLGAWLMSAVYRWTGERELKEWALRAARFSVRRQREDGSWFYGLDSRDRWIDNLHTGYVLVALRRVSEYLGTEEFDTSVAKGYRFWRERLFSSDGIPKYSLCREYPIDIHTVAQAILTLTEFADARSSALNEAWRIAAWAGDCMQDRRGYFYYQLHRWHRIRIPYMRWAQAWMQHALTVLCFRANGDVVGV
jgi:hypothetical protein